MNEYDGKSEAIERKALISLHEHCPEETRRELGLFKEEVEDAIVCGASNDTSILLNRTLGMGTRSAPVTRQTIEAVYAVYQERELQRYFLHVYPDTLTEGPETFSSTGLEKARGWMKFNRGDALALERETELEIRRVGPEGAADSGRIVGLAFGITEAGGPLLAGLVHDPRWNLYVGYDGDQAAGAGAIFVDDGCAWFEWGATDPTFRRRGSQGAIMTARIKRALELGCTVMFTEIGEAEGRSPALLR